VSVDHTADTVTVRATISNPRLIDGQLVQVNIESRKPEEKVVISQTALIADQRAPMCSCLRAQVAAARLGCAVS